MLCLDLMQVFKVRYWVRCSQSTDTVSHTVVQVPQLKILDFSLQIDESLSAEEAQACILKLRQAAELLADLPILIIGEPDSISAIRHSLNWPASDEQLTVAA